MALGSFAGDFHIVDSGVIFHYLQVNVIENMVHLVD
jgi:hypothetical protein